MLDWILDNKEWIFSGFGLFVITLIISWFRSKSHRGGSRVRVVLGDNMGTVLNTGRDIILYGGGAKNANELIGILELRAQKIREQLSRYYRYAQVRDYLRRFEELHKLHIKALKQDMRTKSHELVREIHSLSHEIEKAEFWTRHSIESPDVLYSLRPDQFEHGPLINMYLRGTFAENSRKI